jgi:hypoxanthine phosphoribosyltransferase
MEVLIGSEAIQSRVREIGRQVARDHPEGAPLLVGVLRGCVIFMADLMKALPIPHEIDFISISSYELSSQSSGAPRLVKDIGREIRGRDVIIVEDIVDSGRTIHYLRRNLETRHPRSIEVCTLLDKIERRQVELSLDYVGFVIPDRFVVGYGFDLGGHYRGLPEIHTLEES